jgi:DNA-binding MarR family transcriptional regulator
MSRIDSPVRQIGTKLAVVARQQRQLFDERVEAMGVTRAKYILIATVGRRPGLTQRMIASLLEVTDVTAGRLIDRVTADGLLERRENPQDRRAYCVYLTPAAQPILDKLAKTADAYEKDVFVGFSDADLEQFDSLLDRMQANLMEARRKTTRKAEPIEAA